MKPLEKPGLAFAARIEDKRAFREQLAALVDVYYPPKKDAPTWGSGLPFHAVLYCDLEALKTEQMDADLKETAESVIGALNDTEELWINGLELALDYEGFLQVHDTNAPNPLYDD